jgi:hypothetical protein
MTQPKRSKKEAPAGLHLTCKLCGVELANVASVEDAMQIVMEHGLHEHPLTFPYCCAICTEYKGPLPLPLTVFGEKPECVIGQDVNYGDTCPMFTPKKG